MISAAGQMEELGRFGKIVVEKNYTSLNNVKAAVRHQHKLMLKGKKVRLGDLMVKLKLISNEQKEDILNSQNKVKATIPGYEIMEKLGEGGMGAVYKSRQINMDRLVAIKILKPKLAADPNYIQKFLEEARSVAKLNHNNIIRGIDVGQYKNRNYFVMEFVDGLSIQNRLNKEGLFIEEEAIQIIIQIASAIQYISQFKMVHRDIKPDNIMLTSRNVPKLADLGLALTNNTQTGITPVSSHNSAYSSSGDSTNSTSFVGTPHYISPEQAQNQDVDHRSDIYSLGATLFHMMTGRTPYIGERSIIIMTKHITEDIEDPRSLNPNMSEGISTVIRKMMEKDPDDRYQTAEDIIEDLKHVLETGQSLSQKESHSVSSSTRVRRGRRTSSTGGANSTRRKIRRKRRKPAQSTRRRTRKRIQTDSPTPQSAIRLPTIDTPESEELALPLEEYLSRSKNTKDFSKKEYYLSKAMDFDNDDDIEDELILEAKCRYAYLICVIRKNEALEILLEIIEDYIEFSDNKYYSLAEKKLHELNNS